MGIIKETEVSRHLTLNRIKGNRRFVTIHDKMSKSNVGVSVHEISALIEALQKAQEEMKCTN